jgi:hypothetical protein
LGYPLRRLVGGTPAQPFLSEGSAKMFQSIRSTADEPRPQHSAKLSFVGAAAALAVANSMDLSPLDR